MPKLSQLQYGHKTEMEAVLLLGPDGATPFHVNGSKPPPDALTVRFRPRFYSGEYEAEWAAAVAKLGIAQATIERTIADIVSWDLQDEAGKVLPLTAKALAPVPTRLLSQINAGCMASLLPNAASSNA